MVEMMVTMTIFAMVFGLADMLYVQSVFRAANALELNKLVDQVRQLDTWLETTIQQSTNISVLVRGSTSGLDCTMPANGSAYDEFGLYNNFTPSSCSSGTVHWGTGKLRYIYFSDSTGAYANSGTYVWTSEVASGSPTSGYAAFTYLNSNTNIYNWYLIDKLTFTVNAANDSVTYVIHATDLTRTGAALGNTVDTANSHTLQLTRTVYWRNSVT
jgi:hypothetical protein